MGIITLFQKVQRRIISFYISIFLPSADNASFRINYEFALAKYKEEIHKYSFGKFLMPEWAENTKTIEQYFLESFPVSFLRHQLIKSTMFAHLSDAATLIQKKLISSYFTKVKASEYLTENMLGSPILKDIEYKTSGNSIHHLYHLAKFGSELNLNFSEIMSYIELGGGYGNMAKIAKRISPDTTYTIIDIPIFSYIQYVYLSTVLGRENVVFFDQKTGIIPGKVNIFPLDEDSIQAFITSNYSPDVFVSTWALSESNQATQDLVRDNNYFNAKYLLIAYQKANSSFVLAQKVAEVSSNYIVKYNQETEYLTNNYYLFASKQE